MDATATTITTIISLVTITSIFGKFISTQSKLETQLAQIQVELANITMKLDKRDDTIKELSDRVLKIETMCLKTHKKGVE